jgi:hypothetical protein
MRSIFWGITLAVLLAPALAFASDGATIPEQLSLASMAVLLGCAAVTFCIRRFAPSAHFFQTVAGALLLAACSVVASAIVDVVQAHGLDGAAIARAAMGALLSLLAGANPTMAATARDNDKGDPLPPPFPGSSARAFLPFLFLPAALGLAGCAHIKAIGIDLAQCALGQVTSAVAGIIPDVSAALGSESVNWEQDLAGIGARAGVDAVKCAIESIIGELRGKKAALSPFEQRKIERGQAYLAKSAS